MISTILARVFWPLKWTGDWRTWRTPQVTIYIASSWRPVLPIAYTCTLKVIVLVGTNDGLIALELSKKNQLYQVESANRYGIQDGLISNYILDIEVHGNKIWLATPEGLMRAPIDLLLPKSVKPTVCIESIMVNDSIVHRNTFEEPLEFNQKNIKIALGGSSTYRRSNHPFFNYSLYLNKKQIRSSIEIKGDIELANLSAGKYDFIAHTTNLHKTNSDPIRLSWVIKKHWSDTWWFNTTLILSIASLGFLYLRYRLHSLSTSKQLEIQRKELELRAIRNQINPHFIYNVLNSIQSYVHGNQKEQALTYLSRFSRLIQMFLSHSRLEFIPIVNEIEFLKAYLQMEQLRLPNKLNYDISISDYLSIEGLSLPSSVIQPLVENAIKHGIAKAKQAGHVALNFKSFNEQDDYIIVEIINTGPILISPEKDINSKNHRPRGSDIVHDRLSLLRSSHEYSKAGMTVKSPLDIKGQSGTAVTLTLPVQQYA